MSTEVPSQFEFQHLLAHTFPGFFSAITLFMLIDYWSPLDLTSLAISDLNGLVSFAGFILLIGSILGIIADGIYHSIIEDDIFDRFDGVREYKVDLKSKCFNPCVDYDRYREDLSHYYFFKQYGDDALALNQTLVKSYRCYARFYSNTFLTLIPFSLVIPFYLFQNLQISWKLCMFIALMSFFSACFCLKSGYVAYKMYNRALYSAILGSAK